MIESVKIWESPTCYYEVSIYSVIVLAVRSTCLITRICVDLILWVIIKSS